MRLARPVRRLIEPRPAGDEAPQRQALAHRPGREMALELALAPVPHQLGQGNAHRTDALAAAAEGRGVGQVGRFLDAQQLRRQHRADRAGIDPAIGMAADRAIDRAMVHAGAAADAAQHVLHLGAQHRGAAVVEDDDVIVLRPVEVARPLRAGVERRIGRRFLAGRRARQHAQQHGRVLERGDHLLDAGQHDVHLGQRVGEIAHCPRW